jgi:hypothetical protein
MLYSIDTSSLIDAWGRFYVIDVFPRWWDLFEGAVRDGAVRATYPVLLDLEKKDDSLRAWAKARPNLFIPLDEDIQTEVKTILANHPRLVENRKNRSASDPFIIALAGLNDACVITGEKSTGKINQPNIPDVCQAINIRWINLLDFMREMKWRIE